MRRAPEPGSDVGCLAMLLLFLAACLMFSMLFAIDRYQRCKAHPQPERSCVTYALERMWHVWVH